MVKVFVFRRDFRVVDNSGLRVCIQSARDEGQQVLPVFIYNDVQIDSVANPYFSDNAVQFLVESLEDLEKQLKDAGGGRLYKLRVKNSEEEADLLVHTVEEMCAKDGSDRASSKVFFNKDITPFARARDTLVVDTLVAAGIAACCVEDYTLFSLDEPRAKTQDGTAYKVFHFLYKKRGILHPEILVRRDDHDRDVPWATTAMRPGRALKKGKDREFYEENGDIAVRGGRTRALEILDSIRTGAFSEYGETRDDMSEDDGTTRLSAYLKFGCVSVREVYQAVYEAHGLDHGLIRELYFREFYFHVAWFYPRVLAAMAVPPGEKNEDFDRGLRPLRWRRDEAALEKWKVGETGTPLVDAAMRQLNRTGYMHNRGRMVVAMYLTKDLFQDWRTGERYFATKLVDYDPCQNNAGWQWSASTGSDAQPYFRIMNPYTQQERYDADATYVKRWIPELAKVDAKDITRWEEGAVRARYTDVDYPAPIVKDHTASARAAIRTFKGCASSRIEIE